jgi:hypothetical protein
MRAVVMGEQARLTRAGNDLYHYIMTPVESRGSGVIPARGDQLISLDNVEWSTRELMSEVLWSTSKT